MHPKILISLEKIEKFWIWIEIEKNWIDNPNPNSNFDFGLSIKIQCTELDCNPDWVILSWHHFELHQKSAKKCHVLFEWPLSSHSSPFEPFRDIQLEVRLSLNCLKELLDFHHASYVTKTKTKKKLSRVSGANPIKELVLNLLEFRMRVFRKRAFWKWAKYVLK